MRPRLLPCLLLLPLLAAAQASEPPGAGSAAPERAEPARPTPPSRAAEAIRLGAREYRTQDGRSHALVWQPQGGIEGWIVTLHGSEGQATDEIVLWQPAAAKRRLGIIALQWWLGGDSYYALPDIRREVEVLMARTGATRDRTLLHGFSRGAANLYALVAMDGRQARPLFRHVLANAGGMSADYPPNRAAGEGRFGAAPYRGTDWWLYCGDRDPHPDRDGCPAMRRTQAWLEQRGARTMLRADPSGDHGGFHRNVDNIDAALDWFLAAMQPGR